MFPFISIACRAFLWLWITLIASAALADHTSARGERPVTVSEFSVAPDRRPVLTMGTSDAPPHMIQATDSGLDIDVPRAVLAEMGYRLEVRYMSLSRAEEELRHGRVDLSAPLFDGDKMGIYSSQPHVMYRPTAFSLVQSALRVNTISDLGDYSLMTFQGAGAYLGEVFTEAAERSPRYAEVHNMNKLTHLLFARRTQLVVIDYNIFYYLARQLDSVSQARLLEQLVVHDIFPPVPAVVGFHDSQLRDQFDLALQRVKDDGSYQEILRHYAP